MGAAPKSRRRDPTPVRQRPKRPGSPYVAGQVQVLRLCCGGLISHLGSGPETCHVKFPPAAGSRSPVTVELLSYRVGYGVKWGLARVETGKDEENYSVCQESMTN
ncbi:hypothetical protein LZ31DRAFT_551823 [Colletotrichum somersetense]|nr:hypothetical protein LZ31DRAFT_551823 [Colletotrichum somersetense]